MWETAESAGAAREAEPSDAAAKALTNADRRRVALCILNKVCAGPNTAYVVSTSLVGKLYVEVQNLLKMSVEASQPQLLFDYFDAMECAAVARRWRRSAGRMRLVSPPMGGVTH